jgi:hypothetical protein
VTAPYRIDDVLAREELRGLSEDDVRRVCWAYWDTFTAYEAKVPYAAKRLPGIEGVALYQLNKSVCSYGAALREAERLRGSSNE